MTSFIYHISDIRSTVEYEFERTIVNSSYTSDILAFSGYRWFY